MGDITFDRLSATKFEEFCHDLLHANGFVNIDWRKGTGLASSPADKGRTSSPRRSSRKRFYALRECNRHTAQRDAELTLPQLFLHSTAEQLTLNPK